MKSIKKSHPSTLLLISRYSIQILFIPMIVSCVSVVSDRRIVNTSDNRPVTAPFNTGRFDKPGNTEEPDIRRRAKIRLELAANYFQSRQSKVALDEVNNALSADPSFPDAHVLKGLILMEANQNIPADASFKMALALSPSDADANNTYGWFLCQSNRLTQAFSYFDKAAATPFYATPSKPLLNAGICATKMGSYTQAESYFLRAQAVDNNATVLNYHFFS